MLVKVNLSSPYIFPGILHFMVAALGALYIRDNYPNDYPTLYVFKNVSVPFITLVQSYYPVATI